jgi:SAM-dependent methyltransferase
MDREWPADLAGEPRKLSAFKSSWIDPSGAGYGPQGTDGVATLPSHWNEYHRRWSRLSAPLRPDADIVRGFEKIVAGHDARVLLLGVTPELAGVGQELSAIDRSDAMIANIWPGDTARAQARNADWLAPPFADGAFTAILGDGSLSAIMWPRDYRTLFGQAARLLAPGGVIALRLFKTPDDVETRETLRRNTLAGETRSFHAFKWQLAMSVVAETGDPNIAVIAIREAFDAMFPDRVQLAAATGWSAEDIETIDVYANSPDVYSFPTFAQLRETIPESFENIRLVDCGSYPLAERCPLLAMERA